MKNNKLFLFLFFSSFSVYSLWLFAFFPGIMSFDSVSQWEQASTKIYNNAHPFLHTLLITLLKSVWDTPAFVALFQIIISSLIIAYSLVFFLKLGASKKKIFIVFFILLILPSVGIYNITLWKDVLFAQCITALSIIFIKDFLNQTKITNTKIILVAVLTLLISNMRHNGIIYLPIVPLIYFSFRIINVKKLALMTISIIIFYITLNVIVFNVLHVTSTSDSLPREFVKLQIIGNALRMGYAPSKEESDTIEKLMPLEEFRKRYNCSAIDYLRIDNSPMNEKLFYDKKFISEFDKISNAIIMNNLQFAISDRICLFSSLTGLSNPRWQFLYHNDIDENIFGIKQSSNNSLRNVLNSYLVWSTKYPQRFILWSHFFYILIYIYFFIKSFYTKNYALLGFIIIITINVPALFIFGIARDFRYLYMINFALPFIFLVDDIGNRKKYWSISRDYIKSLF